MTPTKPLSLILISCLALGGCGLRHGRAPTGQVVATVDGQEITASELKLEMAGVNLKDPAALKAAQQAALQNIIARKILAKAARDQKIDKTPDFALQKLRTDDTLLIQAYQQSILNSVPAPTADDAKTYVAANPDMFAQRKIYGVKEIRLATPSDPTVIQALEPLKSIEDVEALLHSRNIDFGAGAPTLDVIGLDPRLVAQIVKLPAGEVFIRQIPGGLAIDQIQSTTVQPLVGDDANKYAMNLLKPLRGQEALQRQFQAVEQKAAATVRYNKAYAPAAPAKAATATPAAPAAAPAAAAPAATAAPKAN